MGNLNVEVLELTQRPQSTVLTSPLLGFGLPCRSEIVLTEAPEKEKRRAGCCLVPI